MANDRPPYILVPEYVLFNAINGVINIIKNDLQINASDETKTLLYKLLSGIGIQKYDFFKQAKSIFSRDIDNPRLLEIEMGYNMQKMSPPVIYIVVPAEQAAVNINTIGVSQDYMGIEFDDANPTDLQYQSTFTRRFVATYQLMIVSDNSNEVILLYNLFKALLISLHPHLLLAGLENLRLGGADLLIKQDSVPKNFYMRSLMITLEYEVASLSLNSENYAIDLTATGIAIDPFSYYGETLGLQNI